MKIFKLTILFISVSLALTSIGLVTQPVKNSFAAQGENETDAGDTDDALMDKLSEVAPDISESDASMLEEIDLTLYKHVKEINPLIQIGGIFALNNFLSFQLNSDNGFTLAMYIQYLSKSGEYPIRGLSYTAWELYDQKISPTFVQWIDGLEKIIHDYCFKSLKEQLEFLKLPPSNNVTSHILKGASKAELLILSPILTKDIEAFPEMNKSMTFEKIAGLVYDFEAAQNTLNSDIVKAHNNFIENGPGSSVIPDILPSNDLDLLLQEKETVDLAYRNAVNTVNTLGEYATVTTTLTAIFIFFAIVMAIAADAGNGVALFVGLSIFTGVAAVSLSISAGEMSNYVEELNEMSKTLGSEIDALQAQKGVTEGFIKSDGVDNNTRQYNANAIFLSSTKVSSDRYHVLICDKGEISQIESRKKFTLLA